METSRISGWASERNVATSSMKTIAIAASIARPRFLNASSWSEVTPPMVAVAPFGSFRSSIFDWRSALTAPVLSPVGLAVMVAARAPSIRVIETGPSTSCTVAMSPRVRPRGPIGSFFSSSVVVAGFADFTTMSRSVSSRIALPLVVPRTRLGDGGAELRSRRNRRPRPWSWALTEILRDRLRQVAGRRP